MRPFIIYRCVVGSRAHGLDDAASDTDRRGIYLPPARLHWSLAGLPEQIEDRAVHECYWELEKFLRLALKASPNVLECLSTPLVEHATPLAEELRGLRDRFLSKQLYQTYTTTATCSRSSAAWSRIFVPTARCGTNTPCISSACCSAASSPYVRGRSRCG